MIPAIFQLIGWTGLQALNLILSTLSFILPDQIEEGISYLINTTLVFNGIFPVSTLWSVIFTFLSAWLLVLAVRVIFMFINIIPGVQLSLKHLKK